MSTYLAASRAASSTGSSREEDALRSHTRSGYALTTATSCACSAPKADRAPGTAAHNPDIGGVAGTTGVGSMSFCHGRGLYRPTTSSSRRL